MLRITPERSWPLFNTQATQALERQAQTSLPAHTLMQRAGLAVAKLARHAGCYARLKELRAMEALVQLKELH